ncbi:MAG: hypothetical protein A2622_13150 [Bdellovibrionales bacterium RIFCSPHIGHO2_01_FULL_40_29]|nr:MAG: hypothetical protein A2622_13150 [Bdellovibrionales bacterium RIFCSPHIGHO2_01_FULL_40_29]OFZ33364.1 MAG: hypothetical protein A3D17_13735 [Bdellovibrionales bacterium RIFCSPHIGHO2_02_FULL_40_15]
MKFKTTAILAIITLGFGIGIYFFEYQKEINDTIEKEKATRIVDLEKDQINFIEIQKGQNKYVLQKSVEGWSILEPVQDSADNDQVEQLLEKLTSEKYLTIAKETNDPSLLKLAEFGLETPYVTFNLKNNLGKSRRIFLGSQKNFEGHSFVRVESENRVLVASPVWHTQADQNLMTYREKRLYRSNLGAIEKVKIRSLRGEFELQKNNGKWMAPMYPMIILDQNKVREKLKQIAEATIRDYLTDGEPSRSLLIEKKLAEAPIRIQFHTPQSDWSVIINQHEQENAVYAMTDRPTNLLRLDNAKWEIFGNLDLDSLRDRASAFEFPMNEVSKIHFKDQGRDYQFVKENNIWTSVQPAPENHEFSAVELVKLLSRIHDLEISDFLDLEFKNQSTRVFSGKSMIILKSDSDNLILQINWGPDLKLKKNGVEKDYYYARTSKASDIFAFEKSVISTVDLKQAFIPKETPSNETTK